MTTDERIRQSIKQTMGEKGLTQQAIADELGVKQPSVAAVIGGSRGTIPQSLVDILDVLDLELIAVPKKSQSS